MRLQQRIDTVVPPSNVAGVMMMTFRHSALLSVLLLTGIALPAAPGDAAATASVAGLDALVTATPAQIKAFFKSPRYTSPRCSDEEFITDAYRGILRRAPDAPGFAEWQAALKKSPNHAQARENLVEGFLKSAEYRDSHGASGGAKTAKKDATRNARNVLFDRTGVLVNDASAFPASVYAPLLKIGNVAWISLQIDNGGAVRADNASAVAAGWADRWRAAGFKVGFWGCARGVSEHGKQAAFEQSVPIVKADAALAVKLAAQYRADFYIADCEDHYQGYNPTDPAPGLNRVYVEEFKRAASAAGIYGIPRALSSMGRVALDMAPWIEEGWDAMPQAYWNAYAVYQPSKCVDFYLQAGWPVGRIHPTIGTFTSEGEKRTVSLQEYDKDLRTRPTQGFSFYLPESYLRTKESAYQELAEMGRR